MNELKPCPFCGGEAAIKEYGDGSGGVYCTGCKFEPLMHASYNCQEDKPKAIEEWNRRTPDMNIPPDRLQEICKAEAEGRLVVLPCKVGEYVWVIAAYGDFFNTPVKGTVSQFVWHKPIKDDIEAIIYMTDGKYADSRLGYFVQSSFGKLVFLAKELAESALKENVK